MNDDQKKLLKVVNKFNFFCEKYQIVYYLAGGNTLGAIRHKGFIPWDDDVDLYITHENLRKLKLLKRELKQVGITYIDHKDFPDYGNTIVRLVEDNTTMFTPARIVDGTPKGNVIELFILDPIPREKNEQILWKKKQWIYTELMNSTFSAAKYVHIDYMDMDLYNQYLEKSIKYGRESVLEELEQDLFSISNEDSDLYLLRWSVNEITFDKNWFGTPKMLPFEDTMLPVPQNPERVCEAEYGYDWMYYPEHRSADHEFVRNPDMPYQEYVKDYALFVETEILKEAYNKKKSAFMKIFSARIETLKKSQELHRCLINLKLKRILKQQGNANSLKECNEKECLTLFFQVWEKVQFGFPFKATKTYLDIGEENLLCILLYMVKEGQYIRALNVLEWKEKIAPSKGELRQLFCFLVHISNAYTELYGHNLENAFFHYKKSLEFADGIVSYDKEYLYYYFQIKGMDREKSIEDLKVDVKSFYLRQREKPEILYLEGQIEEQCKNVTEAVAAYSLCAEQTKNGMIILSIEEYLSEVGGYDD